MFPDFLVIGAQKAGTTWLHRNLQNHPQVWMPKEKELHYFDEKIRTDASIKDKLFGKRPVDERWRRQVKRQSRGYKKSFTLRDLAWDLRYFLMKPNDEWYASLFKQGRGRVTGEVTPDYSVLGRKVVAHVHEIMPETKIIFMMRNPVERAWSQAVMSFDKADKGSAKSVSEKKFLRRFERNSLTLLTDYRQALENWSSFYPEDQIFVGFLEDVYFHPEDLLRRLYGFLGIDPSFESSTAREKIHSRSEDKMPTSLATHLARTYYDELEQLHERFGGYASFWLYCAQRLVDEPPAEEYIPYPLWESPFWGEWVSVLQRSTRVSFQQQTQLQSGPLSSIQAIK